MEDVMKTNIQPFSVYNQYSPSVETYGAESKNKERTMVDFSLKNKKLNTSMRKKSKYKTLQKR